MPCTGYDFQKQQVTLQPTKPQFNDSSCLRFERTVLQFVQRVYTYNGNKATTLSADKTYFLSLITSYYRHPDHTQHPNHLEELSE